MDWVAQWERGAPQTDGLPEGSHNFLYAYALGVAADGGERRTGDVAGGPVVDERHVGRHARQPRVGVRFQPSDEQAAQDDLFERQAGRVGREPACGVVAPGQFGGQAAQQRDPHAHHAAPDAGHEAAAELGQTRFGQFVETVTDEGVEGHGDRHKGLGR